VDDTIPTVAELDRLRGRLAGPITASDDAARIDVITTLERLKSACAAAQARVSVALDASQRTQQAARGVPAGEQGQGVASQIALARQDSPVKGQRHLGLARALVHEMPHTLAALTTGTISEWRATLVVRETATLSAEHRTQVDSELRERLATLGDAAVAREASKIGYRLDPGAALRRHRGARGDRHVSLRPAPDTMSYLTGFLPVEQGVAVHTALRKHADALRSQGDARSRGQIMADTLTERVTGQSKASAVPTAINLVMTDRALLGESETPAQLVGHGPIPAALARSIIRGGAEVPEPVRAWVRRLYTSPRRSALVAMESRRRRFPALLRKFLVLRDEVCRTPWCDAPVRHADHVVRAADGGATSAANGQGLCETCNLTKEAPGWSASVVGDAGHEVAVQTPTGHRYPSRAPCPPDDSPSGAPPQPPAGPPDGAAAPPDATGRSVLEARLAALVRAA
jgi:hypothetical protein